MGGRAGEVMVMGGGVDNVVVFEEAKRMSVLGRRRACVRGICP